MKMGYNIIIGNACLQYHKGDEYIRIDVTPATHPDAPTHCPFTKNSNSRSSSYTAWSKFCDDAGITELFYGQGWNRDIRRYMDCTEDFHRETPLLAEHPGAFALLPGDLEYIAAARAKRERSNGGKPAGFWDMDKEWNEIDNGEDPTLARLLWLEFWIGWALDNCEMPTISNT
jgi:hypothetical protein